ncbi:MAG: IS110 family transposase [Gammaproteobacteria bacterium]
MNTTEAILREEGYCEKRVLYMALELSHKTWRLVFSDGGKERQVSMEARNLVRLEEEIGKAKVKFGLPVGAQVRSCYEAGRDGFWLHRYLLNRGIENVVLESASIEVDRRARRAKTDRLDGGKLLKQLMRHHRDGEFLRIVRVPSVEQEDGRRLHRELERLKKERTEHRNRLQGLVVTQGVVLKPGRDFLSRLAGVVLWNGEPLPADLKAELEREYGRLKLVEEQIRALETERLKRLEDGREPSLRQVRMLARLRGLGPGSAWVLVMEFFGWRGFRNRREVGAAAGLTGTPYASGESTREQGSSQAGNRRVRALIIELAWAWLRYQPSSALSRWFGARFGPGGKRSRRVGIVALARRLLVALWRYHEFGEVPAEAELKPV